MSWSYRLLAHLLSPLLTWRLNRSLDDPALKQRNRRERRGRIDPVGSAPIWIHAASVGEVNAIRPLAEALLKRYPSIPLVISTFTLTGAEQVKQVFEERVAHRFLPADTPGAVRRWLDTLQPRVALIAETELWPELFHQAGLAGLDLILINARMSERGLTRSLRFRPVFAAALNNVSSALCQSREDADRLIRLGLAPGRARVVGNLKFDTPLAATTLDQARHLHAQWGARPCWVAGSTRPGEEPVVLAAHRALLARHPDALLVLAPRHPQRIDEILSILADGGWSVQRLGESITTSTEVVLVDRIGVLQACFAAASVAFVGGSLVDIGGHNLLEPAALGKPVISGPHLDNQAPMRDALIAAEALSIVRDADALSAAVSAFWSDPQMALSQGRAAMAVVEQGRGSLEATLDAFRPRLDAAPRGGAPETINAGAG
jgi:3-deoxy-D-manno-octulosonic-acid transferase